MRNHRLCAGIFAILNLKRVNVMKIKLKQVIDSIDMANDDWEEFYDTKTGETIYLGDPDFDDEHEETEELLDSDPDRFYEFPTQYEIHEYGILEDFVDYLPNGKMKDELARAIRGRGAFRRFRDTVDDLGITQLWYDYQNEAHRKIAISWCEDHNLEYEE